MFSCNKNAQVTLVVKPQLKVIRFPHYKYEYLIHTWSVKAFKITVVNQSIAILNYTYIPFSVKVKILIFWFDMVSLNLNPQEQVCAKR